MRFIICESFVGTASSRLNFVQQSLMTPLSKGREGELREEEKKTRKTFPKATFAIGSKLQSGFILQALPRKIPLLAS